jgi:hypothetical protein
MDQMLNSPGFSIPSIGTPLHQPEEDQQILPHNSPIPTQRQQQQNGFGLALPHQQINNASSSQNLYSLPGFTPQHMLQPQTPVMMLICDAITKYICLFLIRTSNILLIFPILNGLSYEIVIGGNHLHVSLQCN